jgi:hypothetical protein
MENLSARQCAAGEQVQRIAPDSDPEPRLSIMASVNVADPEPSPLIVTDEFLPEKGAARPNR